MKYEVTTIVCTKLNSAKFGDAFASLSNLLLLPYIAIGLPALVVQYSHENDDEISQPTLRPASSTIERPRRLTLYYTCYDIRLLSITVENVQCTATVIN